MYYSSYTGSNDAQQNDNRFHFENYNLLTEAHMYRALFIYYLKYLIKIMVLTWNDFRLKLSTRSACKLFTINAFEGSRLLCHDDF